MLNQLYNCLGSDLKRVNYISFPLQLQLLTMSTESRRNMRNALFLDPAAMAATRFCFAPAAVSRQVPDPMREQ
jgi:hypothetical protein